MHRFEVFDKTCISLTVLARLSDPPLALPLATRRAHVWVETVENHLSELVLRSHEVWPCDFSSTYCLVPKHTILSYSNIC